jgi:hypothetical protein
VNTEVKDPNLYTWHTPIGGQIIVVSYANDPFHHRYLKSVLHQEIGPNAYYYYVAPHSEEDGGFEPWNGTPRIKGKWVMATGSWREGIHG